MVVNQWRNTTEINWTVHCWCHNSRNGYLSRLDENDSLPFGEQLNRLLDHWFPIGHGYYTEGFLSADIEALHLGSKGTIRVQRLASDRFRVQSTHSNALGAVGRLGGKSNLFGKIGRQR